MTDTGVDANATLAVIAAAGRGRRFGADKRRAPLADGRSLLATTLARAGALFPRVAVVIRADDDPAELGLGDALVLRAPRAERGLGASIGDAFAALLATDEAARVAALWLGDRFSWCAPPERRFRPRTRTRCQGRVDGRGGSCRSGFGVMPERVRR